MTSTLVDSTRRQNMAMRATFEGYLRALAGRFPTLPDKPEETVRATVAALWQLAAGQPMSAAVAVLAPILALDAAGEARVKALLARRIAGEPLAYITGLQRFMGLDLLASPAAMIPRRETELLATAAIDCALQMRADRELIVLDICTGSGNVACAIASRVPAAQIFASDISSDAVALANRNVTRCGFQGRIHMRQGDFTQPFEVPQFIAQSDLLVCNPPYISAPKRRAMVAEIAQYEPPQAFDGGPLGINLLSRLIREAPKYLRPGGMVAFELGLGQGPAVCQRVERSEMLELMSTVDDAEGHIRVVVARRR